MREAKIPTYYRGRISRIYRERGGFEGGHFNAEKREILADAIFEVADALECRHVDKSPKDQPPAIDQMFEAMNRVYVDMGAAESLHLEEKK